MSERKASHQKEFRDISVAQLVAESAQQHLEDDIGRKFQKIEGSAGTFIEGALTILAVEDSIPKGRRTLQVGDSVGAAVRTGHLTILEIQAGGVVRISDVCILLNFAD